MVAPLIIGITVVLIATHWRNQFDFFLCLGIIAVIDIFNIITSVKTIEFKTPLGTVRTRTDSFDTFRWCVNLVADVYLITALKLDLASTMAIWLFLTLGALTEIFKTKNRLITMTFAAVGFCYLLFNLDVPQTNFIYLAACFFGSILIFYQLEKIIVIEMKSYLVEAVRGEESQRKMDTILQEAILKKEQSLTDRLSAEISIKTQALVERNNEIMLQADELARSNLRLMQDASLGELMSTFAHELATIIFTLDLDIESGSKTNSLASVDRLRQLKSLLLDSRRSKQIRQSTPADIKKEVESLLAKVVSQQGITLTIATDNLVTGFVFTEFAGSLYFIVQNLIKNASEAIKTAGLPRKKGSIELTFSPSVTPDSNQKNTMVVSVRDNGCGMTPDQVLAIKSNTVVSSKDTGHGIGLKLVMSLCLQNNFKFDVSSTPGSGSLFTVEISDRSELGDELAGSSSAQGNARGPAYKE